MSAPDTEAITRLLAPHVEVAPDEAARLAAIARPVRYRSGAEMFARGEVCEHVVLVTAGLVRAYTVDGAREINLRFLCAPSVATAMGSLLDRTPSHEALAAVTDVEGIRLRVDDAERALSRATVDRLRRVLAERHYLSMERRVRMLQCRSAAERYEFFVRHVEPEIVRGMPGYHVASYIGVAPESLSRARSARARRGRN